jgi:hypothetical protein
MIVAPLLLLATGAMAQQPPNPGPRGGVDERGGGDPYETRPQIDRRPMGPGPMSPMSAAAMQVEAMRNWLELIERYARMSRDPVSSGVAAVVGANDLLRKGPPEKAIEYFTKLLPEVKNEAVDRTIRLQLVELYAKTNQQEKALEQLRMLTVNVPAGAGQPPDGKKP